MVRPNEPEAESPTILANRGRQRAFQTQHTKRRNHASQHRYQADAYRVCGAIGCGIGCTAQPFIGMRTWAKIYKHMFTHSECISTCSHECASRPAARNPHLSPNRYHATMVCTFMHGCPCENPRRYSPCMKPYISICVDICMCLQMHVHESVRMHLHGHVCM